MNKETFVQFPITLTQDKRDGGYVVTFPDMPEAITHNTLEEALAMAQEALEAALEFYFEDGRTVPTPSKKKRGQKVMELPAVWQQRFCCSMKW